MNNKIVIGIWEDSQGIYFLCNNCSFKSKTSNSIKNVRRDIQEHRKVCERVDKWNNLDVDGRKTTLIGFEVIFL